MYVCVTNFYFNFISCSVLIEKWCISLGLLFHHIRFSDDLQPSSVSTCNITNKKCVSSLCLETCLECLRLWISPSNNSAHKGRNLNFFLTKQPPGFTHDFSLNFCSLLYLKTCIHCTHSWNRALKTTLQDVLGWHLKI